MKSKHVHRIWDVGSRCQDFPWGERAVCEGKLDWVTVVRAFSFVGNTGASLESVRSITASTCFNFALVVATVLVILPVPCTTFLENPLEEVIVTFGGAVHTILAVGNVTWASMELVTTCCAVVKLVFTSCGTWTGVTLDIVCKWLILWLCCRRADMFTLGVNNGCVLFTLIKPCCWCCIFTRDSVGSFCDSWLCWLCCWARARRCCCNSCWVSKCCCCCVSCSLCCTSCWTCSCCWDSADEVLCTVVMATGRCVTTVGETVVAGRGIYGGTGGNCRAACCTNWDNWCAVNDWPLWKFSIPVVTTGLGRTFKPELTVVTGVDTTDCWTDGVDTGSCAWNKPCGSTVTFLGTMLTCPGVLTDTGLFVKPVDEANGSCCVRVCGVLCRATVGGWNTCPTQLYGFNDWDLERLIVWPCITDKSWLCDLWFKSEVRSIPDVERLRAMAFMLSWASPLHTEDSLIPEPVPMFCFSISSAIWRVISSASSKMDEWDVCCCWRWWCSWGCCCCCCDEADWSTNGDVWYIESFVLLRSLFAIASDFSSSSSSSLLGTADVLSEKQWYNNIIPLISHLAMIISFSFCKGVFSLLLQSYFLMYIILIHVYRCNFYLTSNKTRNTSFFKEKKKKMIWHNFACRLANWTLIINMSILFSTNGKRDVFSFLIYSYQTVDQRTVHSATRNQLFKRRVLGQNKSPIFFSFLVLNANSSVILVWLWPSIHLFMLVYFFSPCQYFTQPCIQAAFPDNNHWNTGQWWGRNGSCHNYYHQSSETNCPDRINPQKQIVQSGDNRPIPQKTFQRKSTWAKQKPHVLLFCSVKCHFCCYFNLIKVASAPIQAYLDFISQVFHTIFCSSLWLLYYTSVIKPVISLEWGIYPVTMTVKPSNPILSMQTVT